MKSLSYPFVIPAEAGIQRYLNVISYVSIFTGFPPTREQVPAYAGTSLDSCFRRNDNLPSYSVMIFN